MANLKKETLNKCFSLLRDFIDEASERDNRKGVVMMALNQLERVTAGTTESPDPFCIDNPLLDGVAASATTSPFCIDTPLLDGAPSTGGG